MLVVETIAKIRRAFFKQGKPIKAICRELGVLRKVVRKVIRSGATEFRYEREDQPLRKIGRWREVLDQLLSENEARPSRERLTLIRLFEELRGHGYPPRRLQERRQVESRHHGIPGTPQSRPKTLRLDEVGGRDSRKSRPGETSVGVTTLEADAALHEATV
jgi:hypothetical protein